MSLPAHCSLGRYDHDPPQRYERGRHYRNPYSDHGPPRRYDEGRHYHDPYGDRDPPRRYDEGRHYHDPHGDRDPPRRYDEGRHYHDPHGDRDPPRRYDEGRHYHDPHGDRDPPRRYDEGRRYHDPYGDRGPSQRYERGSHYHDPYSSNGYHPRRGSPEDQHQWDKKRDELPKGVYLCVGSGEEQMCAQWLLYVRVHVCMTLNSPPERPRVQLQPRTKSLGNTSGGRERGEGGRASSSIFGQAKPVDTAARDKEIEERLLKVSKFSGEDIS